MIRIPISGGPHSGKTTLIQGLKEVYPDAHFVPEPAELVIVDQIELEQEDPNHKAVHPSTNYAEFSPLVREAALRLEAQVAPEATLVFQDRSLIDNFAYDRLNNIASPDELHRHIATAGYTIALFCAPVGEYQPTAVRRETPEQARRTHEILLQTYEQFDLDLVHLPAVPLQERIELVAQQVGRLIR